MTSADQVALQIQAGQGVVLQRVPRDALAEPFAYQLGELLDRATTCVKDPFEAHPDAVRVLDARGLTREGFATWEPRRALLGDSASPLVVLLDAATARDLLTGAPHVASWAGGVQLPLERSVRAARSEAELRMGANAFSRIRAENREVLAAFLGRTVAVQIGTDRLFVPTLGASALEAAREELDDGLVYLVQVTDEHLAP